MRKTGDRVMRISRRLKREIVSVGTIVVIFCLYIPFMDERWGIYAAIGGGYTVLVLGLLWSDDKWSLYISKGNRSARDLIQGHLVFVLVLVLWIWICRIAKPCMPDWMFNFGPREVTLYHIFSGLGIVGIWWAEQSWLAKEPKKAESPMSTLQQ